MSEFEYKSALRSYRDTTEADAGADVRVTNLVRSRRKAEAPAEEKSKSTRGEWILGLTAAAASAAAVVFLLAPPDTPGPSSPGLATAPPPEDGPTAAEEPPRPAEPRQAPSVGRALEVVSFATRGGIQGDSARALLDTHERALGACLAASGLDGASFALTFDRFGQFDDVVSDDRSTAAADFARCAKRAIGGVRVGLGPGAVTAGPGEGPRILLELRRKDPVREWGEP